jgi:hypothetical protein
MHRERPTFDALDEEEKEEHEGRPTKRRNWKRKWKGEECDYCISAKSTDEYEKMIKMIDVLLDVNPVDYWSLTCLCSPNAHAIMDVMRCALNTYHFNNWDAKSLTVWYYCILDKVGNLDEWLRSRMVVLPESNDGLAKKQEDVLFDCFSLGGSLVSRDQENGGEVYGLFGENCQDSMRCTCEGSPKVYYALGFEDGAFETSQEDRDVKVLKDVLGVDERHLEGVFVHRIFGMQHFFDRSFENDEDPSDDNRRVEKNEIFNLGDVADVLKRTYPSVDLNATFYGSIFYDFLSDRLIGGENCESLSDCVQILLPERREYSRIGMWPLFNVDESAQLFYQKNVLFFQPGLCADFASCVLGPSPTSHNLSADRLILKGTVEAFYQGVCKNAIYVRPASHVRSSENMWDATGHVSTEDLRIREFAGLGDPEAKYPLVGCVINGTFNLSFLKMVGSSLEFFEGAEQGKECETERHFFWFDERKWKSYFGLTLLCDLHRHASKTDALEACHLTQYKNYLLVQRNDL